MPSGSENSAPRAVDLYLNLLKSSLMNIIYLDVQVALCEALAFNAAGEEADYARIANFYRERPRIFEKIKTRRLGGSWLFYTPIERMTAYHHTSIGKARLDNIEFCIRSVLADGVKGDLLEAGAWRGGASIFMRGCLSAFEVTDRLVWVCDSFEGNPVLPDQPGLPLTAYHPPVDLEAVKRNFALYDLLDDQVRFLEGWFDQTLPKAPIGSLALLRLDAQQYESATCVLDTLYDRLSPGGYLVVHDYHIVESSRRAIDDFRARRAVADPIEELDGVSVFWRKTGSAA